jgi:hypothetical protein
VIFFNYGNDVDIGILKLSLNPIRLYIRFNRIKKKKQKNSVLNGDFFVLIYINFLFFVLFFYFFWSVFWFVVL